MESKKTNSLIDHEQEVIDDELPPRKRQKTLTVATPVSSPTSSVPAVAPTPSPLRFESFNRLSPWCTEDRKHRDNMVTVFYDYGNGGLLPWRERTFRVTIYGPSSFPTRKDFLTTLANTSPEDMRRFANNLGLQHCSLEFVDSKKNTVQWDWRNDTKVMTMSTWAEGMVFTDLESHTDSSEYSLPLNEMGVAVFRKILLKILLGLSQTAEADE